MTWIDTLSVCCQYNWWIDCIGVNRWGGGLIGTNCPLPVESKFIWLVLLVEGVKLLVGPWLIADAVPIIDDKLIDEIDMDEDNETEEEYIDDNGIDVVVVLSSPGLLVGSMFLVEGVPPVKRKHVHIRQQSLVNSL